MGIQLASAIETAHRAGIIHRDIKPQNVLISSYGVPGLTDFGIAGRPGDSAEDDANVGVSMPWSPPEVLTGSSNGSRASDVYSLGATIWNLLVGRSPFSIPSGDNSQRAMFSRIVHSKPPMTGRADVPSSLERLLSQAMGKKPEHRPQTAMELARHLQRVEQELRLARTEIVVLETGHDGHAIDPDKAPHSNTPSSTRAYTEPETSGAVSDADATSLRIPLRPTPTAAPTGDAPTAQRPTRAVTPSAWAPPAGDAPTARRPARASTPAPATPAPGAPKAAPAGAEPTTHRPTRPASSGATPTPESPQPTAPVSEDGSGKSLTWAAIAAVAALLAIIVGTGAFLSRGGETEDPNAGKVTAAPGATDPSQIITTELLTTPVVEVKSIANGKVTFAWEREKRGDLYPFQILDHTGKPLGKGQVTKKTSVTADVRPGGTCIQVFARRGSRSSSAGQICTATR
jgi:hypothetical protein